MTTKVTSFMDNLTVEFEDGRMMQMTDQEGRDLAISLNTHLARRAAAELRSKAPPSAPCDVEN